MTESLEGRLTAMGPMDASRLAAALGLSSVFAERALSLFDADRDGRVTPEEVLAELARLKGCSDHEKFAFAFHLHDLDGDGRITRVELHTLLADALETNGLDLPASQVEALADALLQHADRDRGGTIDADEFQKALSEHESVRDALLVADPASWFVARRPHRDRPPHPLVRDFANQRGLFALLLCWAIAVSALMVRAVHQYADATVWIQVARAAGAALNLHGALILLPMLKQALTALRSTRFGLWLPLDDQVDVHRFLGHAAFGFAVVHAAAHLCNYAASEVPFFENLLGTSAGQSGLLWSAVFVAMWATSLGIVRKRRHFQTFWIAHLLFVAWFALGLVHAPRFWAWVVVPLLAMVIERAWRMARRQHRSTIRDVELLSSGVTHLVLDRPPGFEFEPGAYVNLLVPAVAKFEWHPFTVSSAPEDRKALSLHIRTVGNWTTALRDHLADAPDDLRALIDGPYGTPTQEIFRSQVALLVGAGIGVTPFASILRSLHERRRAGTLTKLERVYFFWVSRDQVGFEWLTALLAEIERSDDEFFQIAIHLTGIQPGERLTAATLHIALDVFHHATRVDLVTGLAARTRAGRPDWNTAFDEVRVRHPDRRIDVFVCGPSGLSDAVRTAASRHGFGYRYERF